MRPPWFEATAALGTAGFPAGPMPPLPLHKQIFRGVDVTATPFAFVPSAMTGAPQPRPIVYPTLSALAEAIERRRDGRNIQLVETEDFELEGRPGQLFTAVQIFTLDMANDQDGLLGTAWLDGRGRQTLEPALRKACRHADQRTAA